jgi:hypothetical protein
VEEATEGVIRGKTYPVASNRSVGEPAEGSLPSSCPLGRDATLVYQTAVALAGVPAKGPKP